MSKKSYVPLKTCPKNLNQFSFKHLALSITRKLHHTFPAEINNNNKKNQTPRATTEFLKSTGCQEQLKSLQFTKYNCLPHSISLRVMVLHVMQSYSYLHAYYRRAGGSRALQSIQHIRKKRTLNFKNPFKNCIKNVSFKIYNLQNALVTEEWIKLPSVITHHPMQIRMISLFSQYSSLRKVSLTALLKSKTKRQSLLSSDDIPFLQGEVFGAI